MTELRWRDRLSRAEARDVRSLIDDVARADGVRPVSEHVLLHIQSLGDSQDRHALLTVGGELVGYGHLDSADPDGPIAELAVAPAARAHGYGGQLIDAVLAGSPAPVRLWAHGGGSAAAGLARSRGMVEQRRLLRYARALTALPERDLPAGVWVRPFRAGDAEAWLRLNRRAFVDLPDQGGWTMNDLRARMRQPWFDPDGFLLAEDVNGLVGCHWTKVHGDPGHGHQPMGEVYVLAVDPRARGLGLGGSLTVAGLSHLAGRGMTRVMLYVDASNAAAVALYESLGFELMDTDVQFGQP